MVEKSWLKQYQQSFMQSYTQGRLPHALLVCGAQGSGKAQLAKFMSDFLICQHAGSSITAPCHQCQGCRLNQSQTHPDLRYVTADGNSLTVDQVRAVTSFLQQTAQIGQNKVVVFVDSEKMTESAANALLKTLEEPTAHTYLILLCQDLAAMLPTIVSRCHQLHIQPPVGKSLESALGRSKDTEYGFYNLSNLPELENPELFGQQVDFIRSFANWLLNGASRQQLLDIMLDNEQAFRWLNGFCQSIIRQHAQWRGAELAEPQLFAAVIAKFNADTCWRIYQLVLNLQRQIKGLSQLNRQFAVEALLVDIERLTAKEGKF
jgi:DNA polymerase-3 subunit delta'